MGNSSQVDVLADAIGGALHRDEFASQWVADIRALGAEGERLRMLVEGLHRENDAGIGSVYIYEAGEDGPRNPMSAEAQPKENER
jgi:hypothetical protein